MEGGRKLVHVHLSPELKKYFRERKIKAMGLKPLEFTDSLTDSPAFRENLHAHEKELESTSGQIKGIIKHVKEIFSCARLLSRAQRALAESLENFHFECIGNNQTDDELIIMKSLREFGRLISSMEDERDRILEKADDQFIKPLEDFRKKKIGDVKHGKKTFEKQTTKFLQSQERYLSLSTKKQDNVLQEADAQLDMEQRFFCQASLDYVLILQEVQECKKFECVETLLGFMYSWLTFYHQGHEIGEDCKPYLTDLQKRIQNTRENFEATRDQTKLLKDKMLESRKAKDPGSIDKVYARQGYLFFMEKKALGSTWNKYYCTYEKKKRKFTMIGYNQISGKIFGSDEFFLKSCTRRASESIEKRFCFDITPDDRPGVTYTLQALSEEDRRLWLEAMDGKEPTYGQPGKVARTEETCLDDVGLNFVQQCINELEDRGLEEQGLYRLVGVTSKVSKLLSLGLDRRKAEKISLSDRFEWETKTITSALKKYIWNLPEPIMTYRYHDSFITAAKQESVNQRIADVHALVHRLPYANFRLLNILCAHLKGVAAKSEKNKMTVSNLGVCFGPTLLRPEEESVAGIIESKFCKVVVEILIDNCEKIFGSKPSECEYTAESPASSNSQIGRAHTSPIKHAIVSSYNNGPKPVLVEGAMGSSWDPLHPGGLSHSNVTVNSLHSSSHSSSSNHSTGESHPLGYSISQPNVLGRDRDTAKQNQNRVGMTGGFEKGTSYSQPYLHSGADCNASNSSSSSESVASWPGPVGAGHGPSNLSLSTGPVLPPPYQPPPNLHLTNGKDYGLIAGIPKGAGVRSPFPMTCARTLYACTGEHDGELSFEPNEIITNVRPSCEPGWLEGTLRGKTGLIPENYVEPLQ